MSKLTGRACGDGPGWHGGEGACCRVGMHGAPGVLYIIIDTATYAVLVLLLLVVQLQLQCMPLSCCMALCSKLTWVALQLARQMLYGKATTQLVSGRCYQMLKMRPCYMYNKSLWLRALFEYMMPVAHDHRLCFMFAHDREHQGFDGRL